MTNNKKGARVNRLYYFADKYRKMTTDEDDILSNDMTMEFYHEIRQRIKDEDIILINVNGRVRTGKSTVGLAISDYILKCENKYFPDICPHKKMSMLNVARDQTEKSMMMKNHKYEYTVILTDEINESEKTGQNSTTEKAAQIDQSNVQAARYVHSVYCNPNEAYDPNVDIILNTVTKDRAKKTVRCKLFYKYSEGLINYSPQLLGYVDVYVGDMIDEWIKIKSTFIKKRKSEEEKERLKESTKKDFYVSYMVQKHLKIDLASKYNITRARDMTYVKVTLDVLEEMKPLCKVHIKGINLIDRNSIRLSVKRHQRKRKVSSSIWGEELAIQDVAPILEAYKNVFTIEKTIMDLEKALVHKNESKRISKKEFEEKSEPLQLALQLTKSKIKDNLEELHNHIKLSKEFNKHLEELDIDVVNEDS